MTVWAHHMYATGQVLLPFFAFMTMTISVPTGIKFFNWVGTMWRGQLTFETPMLWALGFLVTFLFGGLTGIILSSPVLDFHVTDSYFVVAHFHYVVFDTVVFAMFAGFYFWWPKFTGRMLDEGLGKIQFWLLFIGFNVTFFPQHQLGLDGMPRRIADYLPETGWTDLNLLSTAGSLLIAVAVLIFVWNFVTSLRLGPPAGDDPWGGHTLEWATSSPPPHHNFHRLPPIHSDRPVLDERLARQRRTDAAAADAAPAPSRDQLEGGRRG
jgi:cytochrome c oxidase subunit 1